MTRARSTGAKVAARGDTHGLIVEASMFLPGPSDDAQVWTVASDDGDEHCIALH